MLGGDIAVAGPAAPLAEKPAPAAAAATVAPASAPAAIPAAEPQDVRSVPRWLTYERKETRIRPDQLEWVEAQRKEPNQRRQGAGERLSDNTLIRVRPRPAQTAWMSCTASQRTSCATHSGSPTNDQPC
jgi:hypothetical protein